MYWPIDGFKCDPNDPDKDQTYGLFTNDFKSIRHPELLADINSVGPPEGTIIKRPHGEIIHLKMKKNEVKQNQLEHKKEQPKKELVKKEESSHTENVP